MKMEKDQQEIKD
jgi:hypothetical protein